MTTKYLKIEIEYLNQLINIEYFYRKGIKDTILFLHGLGADKEDFINVIDYKGLEKYNLICLDLPGHGNSDYIPNLQIDDLVEITRLFINKLNLKSIIIVGHSMGGLVGLLYIQKYKEDIKIFINVEGNLNKDDCNFSRYIASLDIDTFHKEFGNSMSMYDLVPSIIKYSESGILLNLFLNLKIPNLFIYGEKSNISYTQKLEEGGIDVKKILNSGHHPFQENYNAFYNEINQFITNNGF